MAEVPVRWQRLVEFAVMGLNEESIALSESMTVAAVRNAMKEPAVAAAIEQLKADTTLGLKHLADEFDDALRLAIGRIKESIPNAPLKEALKAGEFLSDRHPSGIFTKQTRVKVEGKNPARSIGMAQVLQRAERALPAPPTPVESITVENHESHPGTSETETVAESRETGDDPENSGDSRECQW